MPDPTATPDPMDAASHYALVPLDDAKRIRDEAVTAERERIRNLVAARYDDLIAGRVRRPGGDFMVTAFTDVIRDIDAKEADQS